MLSTLNNPGTPVENNGSPGSPSVSDVTKTKEPVNWMKLLPLLKPEVPSSYRPIVPHVFKTKDPINWKMLLPTLPSPPPENLNTNDVLNITSVLPMLDPANNLDWALNIAPEDAIFKDGSDRNNHHIVIFNLASENANVLQKETTTSLFPPEKMITKFRNT